MTPDTLYRDAAHPAARHGQRRLATSQLRRRASGERRSGGWWLRAEHSAFIPTVVLVVGTLAVLVTLPYGSWRIPGARRVQAVLDHIPQPWKPPRPEYVPAPAEGSAVITTVSNAAAGAAPPVEAPPAATPAARATTPGGSESPAVPIAATRASLPAAVNPAPPAVRLQNFRHQYQTWNNCGPATITMATSHFGRAETQAQAAPVLKPNPNDKNVGPDELVAYVRSLGLQAQWRVGGDIERMKLLLANDIPVVVETWFTPEPNDGMGHYRLLVGYDDAAGRFITYDSYQQPGVNVPLPYGPFDADWRIFNRTYVPVYPAEKAEVVAAILGDDVDDRVMWERALAVAQQESGARPNDPFAWFNMGTSLTGLGRSGEAVAAFDRARALRLPWRMLWYQFQPFEAYLAEGRVNDVLTLTGANLEQTADLEESHYYRGRALQAQGQTAAARASYQAAVRLNPRYTPAHHALSTL